MGTTIRREPVNFDIPASPNYKFLNITNFRGLDVSSNPFELATNTASDCLNVYVDETNTLTTRPRLEKKSFKDGNDNEILPLSGSHISTYNLHNGYLLHYLQDNRAVMIKFIDNSKIDVSGDIPTNVCQYFEQGDKIYLLADDRYMVIDENNILSDVIGYIPTTAVVDLKGNEKSVESSNLLNNKYNIKYHWNGLRNVRFSNDVDVVNEHFKLKNTFSPQTIRRVYSDNSMVIQNAGTFYYVPDYLADELVYQEIVSLNPYNYMYYASYVSIDVNNKVLGIVDTLNGKIQYYTFNNVSWEYEEYTSPVTKSDTFETFEFSGTGFLSDKSLIWIYNSIGDELIIYKLTDGIYTKLDLYNGDIKGVYEDILGEIVVLFKNDSDDSSFKYSLIYYSNLKTSVSYEELLNNIPNNMSGIKATGGITQNGNESWLLDGYNNLYIISKVNNVFDTENVRKISIPSDIYITGLYLDDFTKTAWFTRYFYNNNRKELYYCFDYINDVFHYTYIDIDTMYVNPNKVLIAAGKIYEANDIDYGITATFTIKDVDWTEKRGRLLKSKLYTRFDNNYWLASGNRYYRSANNDPTYFPITEYNDLGDSNENITGFNLANDTTLIAYKRNKIFLIQPFVSSQDTTEYTITESKNTVGNTAIGAPIVTTLTEIPLQINNDGIYGLSQLSNVSATERIADLMSEPINERWLNIDDELITKAQTLNRLYWTYVIIPDNENNKTMIYLLDNRSNSWYYWELPIVVVNSFVKNNRTEFVDKNGLIYYLTTTDIENKSFDTQLVTEYYDDNHKLISWYWQSQVLPLGTMNYSKRLVNTTFILTDTDTQDGYGLNYNFKVFRKLASNTPEKEISGDLNLVRSTTKKTNISKFGFIQLKISNITEESQGTEAEKAYRNNKLRLVGLGLKYVLLEGLIR